MARDARDERALADVALEHLVERGLGVGPHLVVLDQVADVRWDVQLQLLGGQVQTDSLEDGERVPRAQRVAVGVDVVLLLQAHAVRRRRADAASQRLERAANVDHQRARDRRHGQPDTGLVLDLEPRMRRALQEEGEETRILVWANALRLVVRLRLRVFDQLELVLLRILEELVKGRWGEVQCFGDEALERFSEGVDCREIRFDGGAEARESFGVRPLRSNRCISFFFSSEHNKEIKRIPT